REDGTSYLYLAATWLAQNNQCEVRFGIGTVPGATGAVVNPQTGKCLDVDTNTATNGNRAQIYACGIASGQDWSRYSDGSLRSFGKCLDVDAQGTANGTKVQLWECNGSGAQVWTPQANGSLLNPQSGRCLDISAGGTADGTDLQIYDCNGLWTQVWNLPA
ncbi:MAG: ricin-type beta-trefoil lectin domain protein, partial [Glycomyces artemisiae]|nr:ricin-type beta-trefoil lectin domain protein [Glycomyces artemisiae]